MITIGKNAAGKNVHLDLDALLRGRMLVQANSGKGKSWLLRRLAEQLFGKVQVIILDPEGEFATLREKYGYVLVGKGGETPADPRSAALVAHKLLELRASAVCDLYEMKPSARHEWVQRFLEAMIDAPKNLWHPCVVMVDEAHIYAPEKGAGESVAAEAMIGMATRGRKRGFVLLPATQRLGKLRKDLAAEMQTVAIGGTFIDVDRKRAADTLGVYGPDLHKFFDEIKLLERGHFYCLGPAISNERILVEIGPVETSHPEAGSAKHAAEPPPAPDTIAKLLPQLSDLPKQAEEKAKTEAELRTEIRSLKGQLSAKIGQLKTVPPVVDQRAIDRAVRQVRCEADKAIATVHADAKAMRANGGRLAKALAELATAAAKQFGSPMPELPKISGVEIQSQETPGRPARKVQQPIQRPAPPRPDMQLAETNGHITRAQTRILKALAEFEAIDQPSPTREALAFWSEAPPTSGGYKNNLGYLRSTGLIDYPGAGNVSLTEQGRSLIGAQEVPLQEDVVRRCESLLTNAQQKIIEALRSVYPNGLTRDELADQAGVPATSGGYKNNLGAMRTAGIIEYPTSGSVKAAAWLFLD